MLVAVLLAVAGFFPVTASSPAHTICVGLIVDSHSIGGSVSDTCVNVKPGTTGVGVLEAAGHAVTYRRDGLICTIDSVPDTGCSKVDNTHYWAYYHRAPDGTSWSYSVQDARTYQPANRSTEGWVYDNGSSLKPENIPASQICRGLVKPTPTPTPPNTHHVAAHSPTPAPSPTASPSTTPTPTPTKSHRHHRPTPTPTPTLPAATTATAPTATPAAGTKSGGNGNATGALIAAGVIAVLAGATVIGARRRRSPVR